MSGQPGKIQNICEFDIKIKNQNVKKRRGKKNIYTYIFLKARLKKKKTRRALKKKNVNALMQGSKHGALGTDRLIIYSKMYESKKHDNRFACYMAND